jgi:hypothetical protein
VIRYDLKKTIILTQVVTMTTYCLISDRMRRRADWNAALGTLPCAPESLRADPRACASSVIGMTRRFEDALWGEMKGRGE